MLNRFHKLLVSYKDRSGDDYELAGISFFEFVSFRLNPGTRGFLPVLLHVWKDTLSRFFGPQQKKVYAHTDGVAVLDISYNHEQLRLSYVKEVVQKETDVFFSKNNLLLRDGFFHCLQILSNCTFLFFKLWFVNKSKGRKANYALALKQCTEISCLLRQLKKHRIDTLIDFANYEVDSNFLYLLLKERNITVYKVPSPGPLYMHNAILLADYLVLSSGYQLEELREIKTIKTRYIIKAIPEMGLDYLQKYMSGEREKQVPSDPFRYTLGYYSHASWMRKKEKDADNGLNQEHSEQLTLQLIDHFLSENPDYSLTVFLHPREKKGTTKEELDAFYGSHLKTGRYQYAPFDLRSTDSFNEVNIAVVALSTILFERLFVGKKLLICKEGVNGFPSETSSLQHIAFANEAQLKELIGTNHRLSDREFFEKNRLEIHHFSNFLNYTPVAKQ
jgi:hypothetical protein